MTSRVAASLSGHHPRGMARSLARRRAVRTVPGNLGCLSQQGQLVSEALFNLLVRDLSSVILVKRAFKNYICALYQGVRDMDCQSRGSSSANAETTQHAVYHCDPYPGFRGIGQVFIVFAEAARLEGPQAQPRESTFQDPA